MNTENEINEEMIRHYLTGSLEPLAREKFEERLTLDENLREEFEFYRSLLIVKEKSSRYAVMERIEQLKNQSSIEPDYSWAKAGTLRYKVAFISIFVVLVACFFYFNRQSYSGDFHSEHELYFPFENMINYSEEGSRLARGLRAYDTENYKTAAALLSGVPNDELREVELYLGVSYLLSGNADSAIISLEPLLSDSFLSTPATYYLGLSHLQNGSEETATRILSPLLDDQRYGPLLEKSALFTD